MVAVCVDQDDFGVDGAGRLYQRTHALKLVNNRTQRTIPSANASSMGTPPSTDLATFHWTISTWDTTAHRYGDALTYNGAGGIEVEKNGLYHVSLSHGDNGTGNNVGAMLTLSILVDGDVRSSVRDRRDQAATWQLDVSDDIAMVAGQVIQAMWTITWCPVAHGGCDRDDHVLLPSNSNHLSVHRIGGLR